MKYPNTKRYTTAITRFREAAEREFFAHEPRATELIAAATEIVTHVAFSISGRNLRAIAHGQYLGDLVVSFCRTHFISLEHIVQGELLEAATLLRKQMELVARICEIDLGIDLTKRLGKTPNVKHLRTRMKRLYGEYSELAHSTAPDKMALLGAHARGDATYTPLFPVFDSNGYVALNHWCLLSLEFQRAATRIFSPHVPGIAQLRITRVRNDLVALISSSKQAPSDGEALNTTG